MKFNSCLGLVVACSAMSLLPSHADPDFDQIEKQKRDNLIASRLAEERAQDVARALEQKDWLLQSYQEHLKGNNSNDPGTSDDTYARIAANPDLARLAGIPFVPAPDPAVVKSLQTGANADKNGPSLRAVPDDGDAAKSDQAKSQGFHPLITPLAATTVAGLHDFYSTSAPGSVTASLPATSAKSNPEPATSPDTATVEPDPTAVETPGMTAAESTLPHENLSFNLAQPPLPDEPQKTVSSHKDMTVLPQPPSANVADLLHKVTLSLSGQTAPTEQPTAPTPPPLKFDSEEQPAPPPPPPNIGRSRIPDPLDNFN